MPTNFTPLVNGQDADAPTFNAPLQNLDDAIEDIVSGSKTLTSPTITSFTNAVHDHQDAAGGGLLDIAAIDASGADNGDVLTASGGALVFSPSGEIPVGIVVPYAGAAAPSGWLLCDGAAVSRTTYEDLFNLIGTTYGTGDGSTTFNVPDLRGRVALGKDNMGGSSANRVTATQADNLGQGSGAENHTLITSEMPSHNHFHDGVSSGATFGTGLNGARDRDGSQTWGTNGTPSSSFRMDAGTITNTGGGGAHNNVQPYLTLNAIIKAF